jgi:hypothetical protein
MEGLGGWVLLGWVFTVIVRHYEHQQPWFRLR